LIQVEVTLSFTTGLTRPYTTLIMDSPIYPCLPVVLNAFRFAPRSEAVNVLLDVFRQRLETGAGRAGQTLFVNDLFGYGLFVNALFVNDVRFTFELHPAAV